MSSSQPIAFLPGWGFQASIGREFLPPPTHLIDLPIVKTNIPCIKTICNHIEDKIQKSHPILIGWSLGGLLSVKLHERNPNAYKALILIASTPCFGMKRNWPGISNEHKTIFKKMLGKNHGAFFSYYLKLISNEQPVNSVLRNHIVGQELFNGYKPYQEILFQSDLRSLFSKIQVPTLIIQGTKDPIIPSKILSHLRILNPSLNYQTIIGAGHTSFITHKIEIQKMINQFLKSIS